MSAQCDEINSAIETVPCLLSDQSHMSWLKVKLPEHGDEESFDAPSSSSAECRQSSSAQLGTMNLRSILRTSSMTLTIGTLIHVGLYYVLFVLLSHTLPLISPPPS